MSTVNGEYGSERENEDGVPRALFVDNFDSFTYNLIEYVEEALRARRKADAESATAGGVDTTEDRGNSDPGGDRGPGIESTVLRNTASLADVRRVDPDAIVISPGPGHPANERDVGVTLDVLREVSPRVPTLGVCLGLEAAAYAYGGEVSRAPAPIHGKTTPIDHDGKGVFAGLEEGFPAGRYHSLIASEIPDCFAVTATVEQDGETLVMGIRHREHPIECVQFHPESVLTGAGHDLIGNFLAGVE